ncbi:MAG: zinc metallopeptidase [Verrucomicrobiales bacterium]
MFLRYAIVLFLLTTVAALWGRRKFRLAYDAGMLRQSKGGITGATLARRILTHAGIEGVEIAVGHGLMPDYYDPGRRTLYLHQRHYDGTTHTALGIAAHEAGHALQHAAGHRPLFWRLSSIQATMSLSLPILLLGLLCLIIPGLGKLALFGLSLAFVALTGWNLMTLPTELDATLRSERVLDDIRGRSLASLVEYESVHLIMRSASAAYIEGIFAPLSWLLGRIRKPQ